jgi:nucleolar protein 12
MSSLLGSIFGGGDSGDSDSKNRVSCIGLFEKSESLPDRPQHKPVATRQRSKKKQEVTDILESSQEDVLPSIEKKSRKKKKRISSSGEEGEIAAEKSPKKGKQESTANDTTAVTQEREAGDTAESIDASEGIVTEEERTIFVGNLPLATTTRKSLTAIFKDCGRIASARIRSVPVKGIKLPQSRAGDQSFMKKVCVNTHQVDEGSFKNSVQGYVVFQTVDAVAKALIKNNLSVDGMRLRVDRASATVDPLRSVFVGGLPYAAEESTLQEHFVKGCDLHMQDVEGVRIVRDKETFQCKGFGYVLLREKSMVPTVLKLHGSVYMKKPIRVLVCGKRFKGKRGEQDATTAPRYQASQSTEKVTVGAFRRIIARQQQETLKNKRKRGEKKSVATKAAAGGISRRAAIDKKVDKKIKKLQKRISNGMGKTKRG